MVLNKAFQGDYTLNPLDFQHFNVNYLDLNINGKSVPNDVPLQPNFTSNNFASAYLTTSIGTGMYGTSNGGNQIAPSDFAKGFCIYAIGIDPCLQNEDQMPIRTGGNVKLEIRFAEELDESVVLMIHALFPQTIEIDAARNVTVS